MPHYKNPPGQSPFINLHPMCARSVDDFKTLTEDMVLDSAEWGLERKFDGERQILQWHPDGTFRATSRRVGVVNKIPTGFLTDNSAKYPHLAKCWTPTKGAIILDSEMMPPEGEEGSNKVGSIRNASAEKSAKRQAERGLLRFVVFDLLCLNGKWLLEEPFATRREMLEHFVNKRMAAEKWPDFMTLSRIEWEAAAKRKFLADIYEAGGEGGMVKHREGTYTDISHEGRRSSQVLKIKPFIESDVIVLGFEDGKGKYNTDTFGAINFGQWVSRSTLAAMTLGASKDEARKVRSSICEDWQPCTLNGEEHVMLQVGSCSGFTHEKRAEFKGDPATYVGVAMCVKYQGRFKKTGRMRHPNFITMRKDKNPDLCIYELPR
jgi:ATP-dependent DNA ligase